MSRRGKWIVGLLTACVLLAFGTSWYRGYVHDRKELAQAWLMLDTPDAAARYKAASVILSREPGNVDALMIHARENFKRGRYQDSRNDVEALPDDASGDVAFEAAGIGAHSILNIARNTIRQAPERGLDTIGSQIVELLAQVASYRQIIASDRRDPLATLVIRALEADTRAMYLRVVLSSISTQISQTRSATAGQLVEVLGVQTSDDQMELDLLEQEVGDLSAQAIRMQPLAQLPRMLLMKRHLRRGNILLARQSVEMLTRRDSIDVELAIEVALALLNLEHEYYLSTTSHDIELAQAILQLVDLADHENVEYQFATAELLLAKGEFDEAKTLLDKAMSNRSYAGHTHGMCLRGRALIGMGHATEARQLMARLNDRNPSWESKYVQGLAMIADKLPGGLDLLRQAQEKAPASLTVRLAICQYIVDNGGYLVADLDISQLGALAPMHPRVMQMRLDYAAHLGRRDIVNFYINSVFDQTVLNINADDVVLVGHMLLDNVHASQQLAEKILKERPNDPVAMLGKNIKACPAVERVEAARYAVQAIYPLLNADPLHWPLPPEFEAWSRRLNRQAQAAFGQTDKTDTARLMYGSLYLPWTYETLLQTLWVAVDHWPEDVRLKQLAVRVSLWLGKTDNARQWVGMIPADNRSVLEQAIAAYLDEDHVGFDRLLARLRLTGPSNESAGNQNSVSNDVSAEPSSSTATSTATALSSQSDATDPTWLLLEMLRSLGRHDMIAAALQMEGILKAHPRAEAGLLWFVRDMYEAGEIDQLHELLTRFGTSSPLMAQIAQTRLLLATNKVAESTSGISLVGVEALADTSIRWQQTEVEAIAAIARDQSVLALGMLETLGLSIHSQAPPIGLGQVDLLIDVGRDRAAGSIIMQLLSLSTLKPLWSDAYLARAMYFMDLERVLRAVDRRLAEEPYDGVMLYYRTVLLMKLQRTKESEVALEMLVEQRPDLPRTLMLQAQMAMNHGRVDEARGLFTRMMSLGGESSRVAGQYLLQLGDTTAVPSSPAGDKP